ncbi:MAG: hypothetical protein ACP5M9_00400 [Candidatus Micrarchaeia archaeon]
MEKKKMLQVILSIFIGVIFISSYAVLANLQTSTTSKTASSSNSTLPTAQTIYVSGTSNAIIDNYTGISTISVNCNNTKNTNKTNSYLTNKLTQLEGNNSVSTFYQTQNIFNIDLGTLSPLGLYNTISSTYNKTLTSCMAFNAAAQLLVPQYVNFSVNTGISGKTQNVQIPIPSTSRDIYLNVSIPTNSIIVPITVRALIYQNGTIYQLSITRSA